MFKLWMLPPNIYFLLLIEYLSKFLIGHVQIQNLYYIDVANIFLITVIYEDINIDIISYTIVFSCNPQEKYLHKNTIIYLSWYYILHPHPHPHPHLIHYTFIHYTFFLDITFYTHTHTHTHTWTWSWPVMSAAAYYRCNVLYSTVLYCTILYRPCTAMHSHDVSMSIITAIIL